MSEPVDRYNSGKGEMTISLPKPDIVVCKGVGHLDKIMGRKFLDVVEKVSATNRQFNAFCDWAEMNGYDSEVRNMFTQWVAGNRTRVAVHILVGSKLVSMGVSVANLALGGSLVGYTNRTSFDAALRSARIGLSGIKR